MCTWKKKTKQIRQTMFGPKCKGHAWVMSSWSITQPQTVAKTFLLPAVYSSSPPPLPSLTFSVVSPLVKALWEHSKWGKHYKCAVNFNGVQSACCCASAHRKDTFRTQRLWNSCENTTIYIYYMYILSTICARLQLDKFALNANWKQTNWSNIFRMHCWTHKYSLSSLLHFFFVSECDMKFVYYYKLLWLYANCKRCHA